MAVTEFTRVQSARFVIAEALELDAGVVVLILLIAFGSLLLVATITGLLGVTIGIAIARRSQSPAARMALRRGNRIWVGLAGIGATIVSWIFLFSVGVAISDEAWGLVLVYVGGLAFAAVWGWWSGRWYRFSGEPDPLPPPMPPRDGGA